MDIASLIAGLEPTCESAHRLGVGLGLGPLIGWTFPRHYAEQWDFGVQQNPDFPMFEWRFVFFPNSFS